MEPIKTVDGEIQETDPLLRKQKEDVSRMRASLLSLATYGDTAKIAMQNITVLRVSHQLGRIIRYTEMMDKIENKLYEAIDNTLQTVDTYDMSGLLTLIGIQERLQESMIKSHKLLEPYLDMSKLDVVTIDNAGVAPNSEVTILSKESRNKLRVSAQQVLAALNNEDAS